MSDRILLSAQGPLPWERLGLVGPQSSAEWDGLVYSAPVLHQVVARLGHPHRLLDWDLDEAGPHRLRVRVSETGQQYPDWEEDDFFTEEERRKQAQRDAISAKVERTKLEAAPKPQQSSPPPPLAPKVLAHIGGVGWQLATKAVRERSRSRSPQRQTPSISSTCRLLM